jgi:hypothetical protein
MHLQPIGSALHLSISFDHEPSHTIIICGASLKEKRLLGQDAGQILRK